MGENIKKNATTGCIKTQEPREINPADSAQLLRWLNLPETQATKPQWD